MVIVLLIYQLYCSNSFFFHTLACFCFPRYQTRYSFRRDVQLVSIFLSHKGAWALLSLKKAIATKYCLLSLTPLFLAILQEPQYITAGSTVACHFWRKCTPKKVWYEWCMSRPAPIPLHNPGGRSYVIGLWSRIELCSVFLFVFNFQCSKKTFNAMNCLTWWVFLWFLWRGVWSSVLL